MAATTANRCFAAARTTWAFSGLGFLGAEDHLSQVLPCTQSPPPAFPKAAAGGADASLGERSCRAAAGDGDGDGDGAGGDAARPGSARPRRPEAAPRAAAGGRARRARSPGPQEAGRGGARAGPEEPAPPPVPAPRASEDEPLAPAARVCPPDGGAPRARAVEGAWTPGRPRSSERGG